MRTTSGHPPLRCGFTLIELLVVISVIALLLAIALPALSKARKSGDQVKEFSGLRQHGVAFAAYAQDNRGGVLPGYLDESWATAGVNPATEFHVYTDEARTSRIFGSVARRYTWRLAAYLSYARDALVMDKRLRTEFSALPDQANTRGGFQWAFASSPSFGMNTTFVGGDSRRGGFFAPSLARWGRFYVTRMDEPRFTDRLLIFATSRGYHPIDGTTVIPGRHRIEGPWKASRETGQVITWSMWSAPTGKFKPGQKPSTYGHVDFRHGDKALVTAFDGHAQPVSLDDLRDMRRWSNQASAPDWRPQ